VGDDLELVHAVGRLWRTAARRLSDRDLRYFTLTRAQRLIHSNEPFSEDALSEARNLLHDLLANQRGRRARRVDARLKRPRVLP